MRKVVAAVVTVVGWLTAVMVGASLATTPTASSTSAAPPPTPSDQPSDPSHTAMPTRPSDGTSTVGEEQLRIRGCVIRFDHKDRHGRTVPRKHINRTHACVGVHRVYADRRTGELVLTGPHGGAIVFITVSPDETLLARGITCGASGGVGVTRLRCYDRQGQQVPADSPRIYGRSANLWIGWVSWQA